MTQESSTPACGDSPSEAREFAAADTVALTANPAQTPLQESDSHVEHWYCAECGTFDGPIAGSAFCDVCADGSEIWRVVPRSDAEALAHAVSASLTHGERSPLATALSVYLSKHPWSDL